jgi:hypothetical protein
MKYSYNWPQERSTFENALEKIEDLIQDVYNIINRYTFDKMPDQLTYVKIDRWDTWSMDHTLAEIILPMLIQLKETQHGAPYVEILDVPEELQPTEFPKHDVDNTHFERWNWVLDEMIFAFGSKTNDWEEQYYDSQDDEGRKAHHNRMSNGFKLFGKYYENLWD